MTELTEAKYVVLLVSLQLRSRATCFPEPIREINY